MKREKTAKGAVRGGNEPDPEKGLTFWPVYFYSLANLEFEASLAAIEGELL